MKIAFALSGLHRVHRGAEVAFMSIATELAKRGDNVTLFGSGPPMPECVYDFIKVPSIPREKLEWLPSLPLVRNETSWEEATFAPALIARYRPSDFDITATCAFPFTNLVLRRPVAGGRPPHVFVTQNGDWPAFSNDAEYRIFDCDGLVCINPEYDARNSAKYRTALIPNGADLNRFLPGPPERERLGLPTAGKIVLMVSALIPSKNVADGVRAVAKLDDAILVVAGDGPQRDEIAKLAEQLLPGRYHRIGVASSDMPSLYRSVDAFLHLSRNESFGNVYVEAIACGVPSVVYDLSHTRWILGDQAFFADFNVDAIALQLGFALASDATLVTARRRRAEAFGWPAIAAKYREFFEELIGLSPAARLSNLHQRRLATQRDGTH